MTDIQTSYLPSTLPADDTAKSQPKTPAENDGGVPSGEESVMSAPFVLKTPRANSKLILQNMEEVLNSVKKKHRQKHRRKKEQKRLAQMEAAAAGRDGNNVGTLSSDVMGKHKKNEKRHHKKPLQEKTAQENGLHHQHHHHHHHHHHKAKHKERKSPLKGAKPDASASLLNHFLPIAKKDNQKEVNDPIAKAISPTKPTNAFEVLMNARNKSIGSNTPGKEPSPNTPPVSEEGSLNAKRKLKLQEWADKKGGLKRKLDDDARAQYVEQQLDIRAKRLKHMLVNGTSPKSSEKPKPTTKDVKKTRTSTPKQQTPDVEEQPTANLKEGTPGESNTPKNKRVGRPRKCTVPVADLKESPPKREVDPETAAFLDKLCPSVKKSESLLGYFPKVESPQVAAKNEDKHTPKNVDKRRNKRSLRSASKPKAAPEADVEDVEEVPEQHDAPKVDISVTPTARPRRSCVGKRHCDYDDFLMEPDSQEKATKSATRSSRTTAKAEEEVIALDDSDSQQTPKNTPKKLAPLFVRPVPKPSPDPGMLKARQEFLRSGVPEKLRLAQEQQKQYEQNYEESFEFFPKISHVRQLDAQETALIKQTKPLLVKLLPFDDVDHEARRAKTNKRRCSFGALTHCTHADFKAHDKLAHRTSALMAQQSPLPTIANKHDIIKKWKVAYDRFATFKCYNKMREKYRHFSAIDSAQDTEQVTESFVVTRRTMRAQEARHKFDPNAAEEKPPLAAPNGELLFSEKYKPLMFDQMLFNLTPVTQLREFLANWNGSNAGSARNSQTLDESSDCHYESDSNQQAICNTVVLLGPVSSGKTNAVFALANEMNFNVLEINAGMKRTGKKLIQELQEATQSHQIRKESAAGASNTQKRLMRMSFSGKKPTAKKQLSQNSDDSCSSSSLELSQNTRKSLILIEDADIVFDQTDAGFTDAIYTLAASSKRPVIIVASDPNCVHLQRLMQQNTIEFNPPQTLHISKYLSVLSLIENCPIELDDIISLYLYNGRNLRKTLLELQFYIQSGGDRLPNAQSKALTAHQYTASMPEGMPLPAAELHASSTKDGPYMHCQMFDFYSVTQNIGCRAPFPVNFDLLHFNLNSLFKLSPKVQAAGITAAAAQPVGQNGASTRRKTRSPKKAWLSSVKHATKQATPLESLCAFYENVSTAALIDAANRSKWLEPHDRLSPYVAEHIAHELVERAIESDLAVGPFPYKLYDEPAEEISVTRKLGWTNAGRGKRARCLDFEPALRAICRSEESRAAQERRSTRFYHYLRASAINLTTVTTHFFEGACRVLQEPLSVESSGEAAEPTDHQ